MATPVTRGASQLTTGVERHVVRRGIAAVGLVSIALILLLDVPGKFDELPYVGVLFVALIITAVLLAEAMIRTDDLRVWLVAGAVSMATILGCAISRTSGPARGQRRRRRQLDRATGLASLLVEGVVVLLVLGRLADRRTGVVH